MADLFHLLWKTDDGSYNIINSWDDEENIARALSAQPDVVPLDNLEGLDGNRASTISPAKATEEAKRLVTEIFESWARLRHTIHERGVLVQKRWSKKTLEQRKKILLAAWPDMSHTHRPDIDYWSLVETGASRGQIAPREAFYFPHITLDDLTKSKTFLVLLHSRASRTPDTFANADMNSIRLGLKAKVIKPEYLRGYTMHLTGETKVETYGRLTFWGRNPKSALAFVTGVGTQPGEGLVVLQLQKRILRFLVDCVKSLLHDLDLTDSDSMGCLTLASPDFTGLAEEVQSTHLDRLLDIPYTVPDRFDFGRVHTYVNAKRDELEDHLWLLREDPAYFAAVIQEEHDHKRATILAEHLGPFSTAHIESQWDYAIKDLVVRVYCDAVWWKTVWRVLENLEIWKQHHERDSSPNQGLSKEYRRALSYLTCVCDQLIGVAVVDLKDAMIRCSSFRKYQKMTQSAIGKKLDIVMGANLEDRLCWLLLRLRSQEASKFHGLPTLLHEVERLITVHRKEKDRLSPRLARVISNIGILAEIQRQLALSSPGGQVATAMSPSEVERCDRETEGPSAGLLLKITSGIDVGPFGVKLSNFDYPADKKRTASTTAQMRSAEAMLDGFWSIIDGHFVKLTGKPLYSHMKNVIEPCRLARTPEWREVDQSPAKGPESLAASLRLSTLEERTQRTVARDELLPLREKVKTRVAIDPDPQVHGERQQESLPATDLDGTVFDDTKLSKKDHRVLAMLFPPFHVEGITGELHWTNFLHTMTSLGFTVKKLDGSASLFSPVHGELIRSIIFHEPHPEKSIPLNVARQYGRRLTRAYGWTAQSFIRE